MCGVVFTSGGQSAFDALVLYAMIDHDVVESTYNMLCARSLAHSDRLDPFHHRHHAVVYALFLLEVLISPHRVYRKYKNKVLVPTDFDAFQNDDDAEEEEENNEKIIYCKNCKTEIGKSFTTVFFEDEFGKLYKDEDGVVRKNRAGGGGGVLTRWIRIVVNSIVGDSIFEKDENIVDDDEEEEKKEYVHQIVQPVFLSVWIEEIMHVWFKPFAFTKYVYFGQYTFQVRLHYNLLCFENRECTLSVPISTPPVNFQRHTVDDKRGRIFARFVCRPKTRSEMMNVVFELARKFDEEIRAK